MLHAGPRSTEPDTVERLFHAIGEAGLRPDGPLHTLSLADADADPHGVGRSILRQPVT